MSSKDILQTQRYVIRSDLVTEKYLSIYSQAVSRVSQITPPVLTTTDFQKLKEETQSSTVN